MKSVGILLIVVGFLIGANDESQPTNSDSQEASDPSDATELFARIHQASKLNFQTASAGYVVRELSPKPSVEAQVENVRKALTQALEIRVANDKALGRQSDMERYQSQLESNVAEYRTKMDTSPVSTYAVRYFVSGQQYRVEMTQLSNQQSLAELSSALTNGSIDLSNPMVRIWSGDEFGEVSPSNDDAKGLAAIGYEETLGARPDFMYLGRSAGSDGDMLKKMEEMGLGRAVVKETLLEDEQIGVLLTFGSRESKGAYGEFVILPEQGYVTRRSAIYNDGVLMMESDYSQYVDAGLGYFIPEKVEVNNFEIGDDGVPFLHSSKEMVAFETPTLNADLSAELFDVEKATEGHRKLTHLLPQGDPYMSTPSRLPVTDTQMQPAGQSSLRFVLVWLNIAVLIAILIWRQRRQSRESLSCHYRHRSASSAHMCVVHRTFS